MNIIIKAIKNKMKMYRDSLLIKEDMILSARCDVEVNINYLSQYIESGDKIILDKIANLKEEEKFINTEIKRINRKMDSLFYKLINKICGDCPTEYDIPDEYYIEQAEIIFNSKEL